MPVLATSKFDEDPMKMNVLAWRHHFPIINICEMFKMLKAPYCEGSARSGRNSNLSEILCLSTLPTSLTKIGSKLKALA